MTVIGTSVARADGPAKARGEVGYAFDYEEAGAIHAQEG